MHIIAVDWSGARTSAAAKIWLAEVKDGRLLRLGSGRGRDQIAQHLIAEADRDPELVVGLDFAFAFPAWFQEELGVSDPRELWERVADQGERWLQECPPPFWGRTGTRRPDGHLFRRTELDVQEATGARPESVFQIAGAGAVGTGSIRGMPILRRLATTGFSIWPFDDPALPVVVEIYPRLFTGPLVKTDPAQRETLMATTYPELDPEHRRLAAASDDALDAAVSALEMARHAPELLRLPTARDSVERLEGAIWYPKEAAPAAPQPHRDPSCPFCSKLSQPDILSLGSAHAFPDGFPVTEGHTLVVPGRHVASLFELSGNEWNDVWRVVARVRTELEARYQPDGFTIGVNDGEAAGQTVGHAHVHVIPRRRGDVPDPRGGVRWVIPDRASYWEQDG
jgi:diadenosine tetraphosphate (Ap4A) HIT family hydrolase